LIRLWKIQGFGTEGVRKATQRRKSQNPHPSKTVKDAVPGPCQAVKGMHEEAGGAGEAARMKAVSVGRNAPSTGTLRICGGRLGELTQRLRLEQRRSARFVACEKKGSTRSGRDPWVSRPSRRWRRTVPPEHRRDRRCRGKLWEAGGNSWLVWQRRVRFWRRPVRWCSAVAPRGRRRSFR